jgi:hypothetical protein
MDLQRPDKIIVVMYKLSNGSTRALKYEDIVVKAFEMYPHDFALRGYPKYPDSSDIHKPLYGPLKRAGLVLTGNKRFRLTPKGVESGRTLEKLAGGRSSSADRLTRTDAGELDRIYQTEAFKLFLTGEREKILDTDFYAYLGVTVRTEKNEFLGRLTTVGDAVRAGNRIVGDARAEKTKELHQYLIERFADLIGKVQSAK